MTQPYHREIFSSTLKEADFIRPAYLVRTNADPSSAIWKRNMTRSLIRAKAIAHTASLKRNIGEQHITMQGQQTDVNPNGGGEILPNGNVRIRKRIAGSKFRLTG